MRNSLRALLDSGTPLLGYSCMYPAPGILERVGKDWDWIWIDGQHGQFGYESILESVRVCDCIERPSVVRVASHEYGEIGRVLDTGASALMVPMVETGNDAGRVVEAAKFAPLGRRSFGGRRPTDLYGRSFAHTANDDVLLIAQIETHRGLENLDTIAGIEGIDGLFFGPDDMAMQRGLAMDEPRDVHEFLEPMERVAEAAQKHGKIAGTTAPQPEAYDLARSVGFSLLVVTGDVVLLAGGSEQSRSVFDGRRRSESQNSAGTY